MNLPVDPDQLRTQAEGLLQPPVIYVPIRHHSPVCALHTKTLIREHKPAAVLVEGPPSFDAHIDLLLDPAARMPIAIYSHATFDRPVPSAENNIQADGSEQIVEEGKAEPIRFSSYFPFCDYSPELVALAAGRAVGAHLGFIDLDHDHDQFARFGPSIAGHADERVYEFSETLSEAASKLGCRDHNELWDHMVETTSAPTADVIAAVLTYGALARAGASEEQLQMDGTDQRELAMAEGIASTLRSLEDQGINGPIVVVTGAFHTVVLPDLVNQAMLNSQSGNTAGNGRPQDHNLVTDQHKDPATDQPHVELGEPVDAGHGIIRYSFDRLDALSGYGAGMPSPRWYQSVWDYLQSGRDPEQEPAKGLITQVARTLRDQGEDGQPSLPSVVDGMVAAQRLGQLRGRDTIARDDVVDAMVSCFTKSEDSVTNRVRAAAAREMTGFDLGQIPPDTPRVPLAKDFDRLLAELGLVYDTTEQRQVNLDVYRSERDRRRSRLLHGLGAIGVVYGRCVTPLRFSRAGGRDVIRERWTVQLGGATDASLTESAVWGASIEEAVTAKTRSELQELLATQPSALSLMRMVMLAAQRGVPSTVAQGLDELRARVAVDPSLTEVVAALSEAELLWSAREPLGGSALSALPDLALQLYVRACQLGGRLHEAPEEAWPSLVDSLDSLHRILGTKTWESLDEDVFWSMLAAQRNQVAPGTLRGAIGGLEWRGGRIDDPAVIRLVRGHIDPSTDGAVTASFLSGLILVAREALWEIDGLVAALSEGLGAYDNKQFLRRAPGLRSAFAALTPRQTDRLADVVAQTTGANANVRVSGIGEADVLRHAELSTAAAAQLEAEGFGSWLTTGDTEP